MFKRIVLSAFCFTALITHAAQWRLEKSDVDKRLTYGSYKWENVDGKEALCIQGRRLTFIDLKLPELAQFTGQTVKVFYEYKIENVPVMKNSWEGFKVMLRYDVNGKTTFNHAKALFGTTDWKLGSFVYSINKAANNGKIRIIIPGGKAYVRNLTLVTSEAITRKEITPTDLLNAYPVRSTVAEYNSDHITFHTNRGGFAGVKVDYAAKDIQQIEMDISCDKPGIWELGFDGIGDDGKPIKSIIQASVIPDGKFRKIRFPVNENLQWRGRIKNLKLLIHNPYPETRISLRSIRGVKECNTILYADRMEPGKAYPVELLRPRGKYQLSWNGGKNHPAVELQFVDRDKKALGSVTLKENAPAIEFQVPAMAMLGNVTVKGKADGFPMLKEREIPLLHPEPVGWRGSWIWCQYGAGPEDTIVWFRKEFEVSGKVSEAKMLATGDDGFVASINGKTVGWNGYWPTPKLFDITSFLKPGKNTVEFRVKNVKQNGGMICDLYFVADDKVNYVCSDETWKVNAGPEKRPEKIDKPVAVLGNSSIAPWNSSLGYIFCAPAGIAELKKIEKNTFTVKIRRPPVAELNSLGFKTVDKNGKESFYRLPVKVSGKFKAGETVRITYDTPKFSGGKLYLADDMFRFAGDSQPVLAELPEVKHVRKNGAKASIITENGRQMLLIDGKKYNPIFSSPSGIVAYPQKKQYLVRDALNEGIDLINVTISFRSYWLDENKFDFTQIDKACQTILNVNPNAKLMFSIACEMPDWWIKKYPDDGAFWSNGSKPAPHHTEKQDLASKRWLKDARIGMKAFFDFLKGSDYSGVVFAISPGESRNREWFWNNFNYFPGHLPGYSKSAHDTFHSYLKEKYPDDAALQKAWNMKGITLNTAPMPKPAQLSKSTYGALLDPAKDQQLIDWFSFRNRALGEAVIELCRIVKEEFSPDVLAGAYYGYFLEFNTPSRRFNHDVGHNWFIETIRSPYVDFTRAPSKYGLRFTGMSDMVVNSQDSYKLNNKIAWIEGDFRSWTCARTDSWQWGKHSTVTETVGAYNRMFGMALASGTHIYYSDFGGWLEEDIMVDLTAEQQKVVKELPPVANTTPYELCFVGSRESVYYSQRDGSRNLSCSLYHPLLVYINEAAIPYRQLVIDDLMTPGVVPAHKMYVMMLPLVLSEKERTTLMARFEKEKATVLWLYAPGLYQPDKSPDFANAGKFLGLKLSMDNTLNAPTMTLTPAAGGGKAAAWRATSPWFYAESGFDQVLGKDEKGRAMLVKFKRGNSVHYFSTLVNLPNSVYRKIAADAGVHCFNNGDDPMWIGNDVVFLHAKTGGEKSIILPPGTRMRGIIGPYKGKVFASGDKWQADAALTYGFIVERK